MISGGEASTPMALTEEIHHRAVAGLIAQHSDLGDVVSKWGYPPFWTHPRGFPGLVIAILGQQVSLESAQAAFAKLKNAIGSVHPEGFLSLEPASLKTIGFSRQKASYVTELARGIIAGEIVLDTLESMDNDLARRHLMERRGIGAWTADTYLLFSLRRADAWPSGDLALARAIKELRGLTTTPGSRRMDQIADHWKPWRAVAASILWHHYLCERGRIQSV
jgi:DNA-3-methyladenine glycosylase II